MEEYVNKENMLEFITGQRMCVVTFTNRKHINKIKKLYEENKKDFSFFYENDDGSVCAKIPLKWFKLSNPKRPTRELSEEERDVLRERMRKMQAARKK